MNKTININLGGIFFHIDEDAYQKLRKYLDAIRRSLSDDPKGKDEILNDIESRIGEILSQEIKDVRQVVNENDIDGIINVMGKPEEYAGDEEFFDDNTSYTSNKRKNSKKLYRDASDKFLGGVCSGLGHFFGIDVTWIRLGWLLLAISGVSVILYPILWIILPEANSTSEKLEMEGEAVNISNIEKKIKEEFNKASGIVKDGIDDVTNHIKNGKYDSKVRSGLHEIIALFSRVFRSLFKVGGKFIGILILFASTVSLLAILFGGFSLGSFEILGVSNEFTKFPAFIEESRMSKWILTLFGFAVFAIPVLFLFMLGIKLLSKKVTNFSRTTKLSLLGLWLLSVLGLGFAGLEYKANEANHFNSIDKFVIADSLTDTLSIKMIAMEDYKPKKYYNNKIVFTDDLEKAYKTNVRLDIRESNTNKMYLKVYKESFGISKNKARELAESIEYNYKLSNNNLLLDAYFLRDLALKNRKERIKLVLFVPEGKTIYLDKSTKYILSNVDNIQDIYDKKMIRHYYQMTTDGLNCLDCFTEDESKRKKNTNVKKLKLTIDSNGLDMEVK